MVIRTLLKLELSDLFHVFDENLCLVKFLTQLFNGDLSLLLLYVFVLFLLVGYPDSLPGQVALYKVYKDEAKALHVVSTGLFKPIMSV